MSAGGVVDYKSAVPGTDHEDTEATVAADSWDGVRRYTSARQLYDFPLAVIVGLKMLQDTIDHALDRADEIATSQLFAMRTHAYDR